MYRLVGLWWAHVARETTMDSVHVLGHLVVALNLFAVPIGEGADATRARFE